MHDTLFDSQNAAYAQAMFEQYARNPESVSEEWRKLFSNGGALALAEGLFIPDQLDGGKRPAMMSSAATPPRSAAGPPVSPAAAPAHPTPAAPAPPKEMPSGASTAAPPAPAPPAMAPAAGSADGATVPDNAAERLHRALPVVSRAVALVQAFRDHGHQLALIDPLGSEAPGHPQLAPSFFGTSMEELSELPASLIGDPDDTGTVADALNALREIYAGSMGYEFEHLDDHVKVNWLWEQVESRSHIGEMTPDDRRNLFKRLSQVEGLEQFLHRAYLGQKRFSIEGTDALVPMLDLAMEEAARNGAREVVLGMAHRGRLNVLTHTVGVSYGELLAEFEGPSYKGGQLDIPGTGDVKYHHGARGVRDFGAAGSVRITLAPNPSHLEFVNPVVTGMARSQQMGGTSKDAVQDSAAVVPITIHGDAAFSGEGIVAETLNMARLKGYDVGGTLHIIVNNQVGFTTNPTDSRSTFYASDVAKGFGIPVVHVNADDPEACLAATRLAMAYRARFQDDFVIDLVGYRRHGHNEGDEPAYTQPMLYKTIASHPTVADLYGQKLVEEEVISGEAVQAMKVVIASTLRDAQDKVRDYDPEVGEERVLDEGDAFDPLSTAVYLDRLEEVNGALVNLPEGFTPHPKLWRQLARRATEFGPNKELDWGHAESLAFGSLLLEGIPIRLTGQDAQRGTFSHRHLLLHDVETGEEFVPVQRVSDTRLEVFNSPLTETAVIGFEYGYSVGADRDLIIWEAQFGDFANVAQVMIDQFLSAGRTKWGQQSRLVLLLPHGYEGQGPEHSSARLERFLQLCAE
ncbi:MAG: 2-oxoglutarate dehydrogenase E1 component, partial [Gemmatimonadota bacterium]|nr:2-oxoglutarate dehydrogenase E1 component [Gemmatimonadota bacterium]